MNKLFLTILISLIAHQGLFSQEVDVERIKKDVEMLCATPKARNYKNLGSLNQAANYIADEWLKLGLVVDTQAYRIDTNEYKNLICSFGPKDAERIIVGAHYDVCEEQHGADDNASGVAGILELARMLSQNSPNLKYRIDLVAYTLEEPPYFRTEFMGSAVHAKYLHDNNIEVKGMIVLEMIGFFSDKKGSQDYPFGLLKLFYPNRGDYISVVSKFGNGSLTRKIKRGIKRGSSIPVSKVSAPAWVPGIDFSDHLNYWKYKYKALMITDTAFYRNKNYHKLTDLPNTLNYNRMGEVIKGVYYTIISLK